MNANHFNAQQQAVLDMELHSHIFLEGPFKSGKTSTGTAFLRKAAAVSDPSRQILVLTPQRSLSNPYRATTRDPDFPSGVLPTITTFTGLSRQFIRLYFPQIANSYGFQKPRKQPVFLSMETAQYFMRQICTPLLEKRYFLEIRIDQARLFSQILDTMNKAALVGYPLQETALRLKEAWSGESIREKHYEQAQECALAFRKYCLKNDLLDFSLQVEIFRNCMKNEKELKEVFFSPFQYLIADNLEEDVPVLHDLILSLAENIPSMLLIKDNQAGFRSFLGADPTSADRLKSICPHKIEFTEQFDIPETVQAFNTALTNCILRENTATLPASAQQAFSLHTVQFYPEMIADICQTIHELILKKQAEPGDIAVLSPFLPDSLKFSLAQKLQELGIPFITSRPSRTLEEEPITRAVLAFAKAAHPQWELSITVEELRHAIMTLIPDCDVIRAALLAKNTLQEKCTLDHYYNIPEFTRDRITNAIGIQFDTILNWIEEYQNKESVPLDIFLSIFFGEVLSQPGFSLHEAIDDAALLTSLIQSMRDFRLMFADLAEGQQLDVSKMYIETLQAGLLPSAHPLPAEEVNAVIVSPAFTFLMRNQSVKYQFWLDIGSIGWWERLDQPLTHPYVLSRNWSPEKQWTDADEFQTNQTTLARMVRGLLDRCEGHVYLYVAGLNQAGINQSSPLLSGMQLFLKRTYREHT